MLFRSIIATVIGGVGNMCDSTKVIGGQFLQQIIFKSKTIYNNISKLLFKYMYMFGSCLSTLLVHVINVKFWAVRDKTNCSQLTSTMISNGNPLYGCLGHN